MFEDACQNLILCRVLPIARELGKHGIRCNVIAPGLFETPLFSKVPPKVRTSETLHNTKDIHGNSVTGEYILILLLDVLKEGLSKPGEEVTREATRLSQAPRQCRRVCGPMCAHNPKQVVWR